VTAAVVGWFLRIGSPRRLWMTAAAGLVVLSTWALLTTQAKRDVLGRIAVAEVHPPAGTPVQADKLEPINPGAVGTAHAIVSEPSFPQGLAVEQTAPPPNTTREWVRVVSVATIHSGPSVTDTTLGTAPVGAEAEVSARDADWVKIFDPASGKVGWINSNHLVPAPAVGEQSPDAQADQVPSGQQQAALGEDETLPMPPPPQRALKKKSQKEGWRKKRHKRGLAFRFVLRLH
jgi:hypothetical protein